MLTLVFPPTQIPPDHELSPELVNLLGSMLEKDPMDRIKLHDIKVHPWVTGHGFYPMLKMESNCCLIEVTDDEVENCVKSIPKLDTLILVKVSIGFHLIGFNIAYVQINIIPGNDKETLLCKSIP